MENGYYRKRPINWDLYKVDVFAPHLFQIDNGCGANALSVITGVPPTFIKNTNKQRPNHWKDSFMIRFLKERGYKTVSLTKCDVTNRTDGYVCDGITSHHVLLLSQLLAKNTASWTVVYNNLWYHNFETCALTALTTVNGPVLTGYVIFHPSWKSDNWHYGKNIHQINNEFYGSKLSKV